MNKKYLLGCERALELIKGLCLAESILLELLGPSNIVELFLILSSILTALL